MDAKVPGAGHVVLAIRRRVAERYGTALYQHIMLLTQASCFCAEPFTRDLPGGLPQTSADVYLFELPFHRRALEPLSHLVKSELSVRIAHAVRWGLFVTPRCCADGGSDCSGCHTTAEHVGLASVAVSSVPRAVLLVW